MQTPHITPKELEVLKLVAEGLSNKDIATKIHISENTIKFHVNSLMTKFDQHTRLGVVIKALKLSILTLSSLMPEVNAIKGEFTIDKFELNSKDYISDDMVLAHASPKPHYDNT